MHLTKKDVNTKPRGGTLFARRWREKTIEEQSALGGEESSRFPGGSGVKDEHRKSVKSLRCPTVRGGKGHRGAYQPELRKTIFGLGRERRR